MSAEELFNLACELQSAHETADKHVRAAAELAAEAREREISLRLLQGENRRLRRALDALTAKRRDDGLRNLGRGIALAAWLHLVSWHAGESCGDCPFCVELSYEAFCRCAEDDLSVDADEAPPDWCPIDRFGPLLVHRGRLGRGGA